MNCSSVISPTRHRELAMGQTSAAGDEARDPHVVGRVGEDDGGDLLDHQRGVARHLESVAAEDPCGPSRQRSPGRRHCSAGAVDRLNLVFRLRRFASLDEQIDLAASQSR